MMTGDMHRNARATSREWRDSTYNRLIANQFPECCAVRRSNCCLQLHNKPANLQPAQREN
jgi:hypothetical protein